MWGKKKKRVEEDDVGLIWGGGEKEEKWEGEQEERGLIGKRRFC